MKIKCTLCEKVFDREVALVGAKEVMDIHLAAHEREMASQLWAVTQAVANGRGDTKEIKELACDAIITRHRIVDGIFECVN